MSELEDFHYEHGGLRLSGRIARPAGPGPHPAVLVMHSAMGLDDHVCRRAADLAAKGYVALVADMYGEGPAGPELDHIRLFMGIQEAPDVLRARVVAAYDALRALPEVDAGRISAIGFCFGGQCVLELARSGAELRSVVSFHGLLKTASPAAPGAVKARVLVITGAKDPYAPPEDVALFQQEMDAAGGDWQVTIYGEGYHAFTTTDARTLEAPGTRYDPLLDRLSWAQATAFLEATLE